MRLRNVSFVWCCNGYEREWEPLKLNEQVALTNHTVSYRVHRLERRQRRDTVGVIFPARFFTCGALGFVAFELRAGAFEIEVRGRYTRRIQERFCDVRRRRVGLGDFHLRGGEATNGNEWQRMETQGKAGEGDV